MDAQAEQDAGETYTARFDGPEECHDQGTEEAFAAASGAYICDHWVQKPCAGVLESSFLVQAAALEHCQYQPASDDVGCCEKGLAEAKTVRSLPGGGQQDPCE